MEEAQHDKVLKMNAARYRKELRRLRSKHAAEVVKYAKETIQVRGALRAGVDLVARPSRGGRGSRPEDSLQVFCQVRRRHVKGKGAYQGLGTAAKLGMAYDDETCHKKLARSWHAHPKTVARNKEVVAAVYMKQQTAWLKQLLDVSKVIRPASVVVSKRWDETKEIVTVDNGNEHNQRDSFDSMVSAVRVVLSWPEEFNVPVLAVDLVVPPVPLLSPNAENLYAGTYKHPALKETHELLTCLIAQGKMTCLLHECDGATGNDRLMAYVSKCPRIVPQGCVTEFHWCGNHNHHLISTAVVTSTKANLVATVYKSSMFLSQNNHFLRLQRAVSTTVAKKIKVVYTKQPESARLYALEFRHFVRRTTKLTYISDCPALTDAEKLGLDVQNLSGHGKELFAAWDDFISIFNTPWWETNGKWRHRFRSAQKHPGQGR